MSKTIRYVNIDTIQKEYLPLSKKAIRRLVHKNLKVYKVGGRIYVNALDLENFIESTTV
jgi:hypothetical protein